MIESILSYHFYWLAHHKVHWKNNNDYVYIFYATVLLQKLKHVNQNMFENGANKYYYTFVLNVSNNE